MAVRMRLMRMGKKKQPFYRIVVADARSARDGKYLECVGFYHPIKSETKIDKELVLEWLKKGAEVTETVGSILRSNGIDPIEFRKAIKKKKKLK